jgi:hypothetical protein
MNRLLLVSTLMVLCSSCGERSTFPDICDSLEPCGVADNGFNLRCQDGTVELDDLTEQIYCDADGNEVAESCDADTGYSTVHECPGACATADTVYAETPEELPDYGSLCAPIDNDAGV